jgi:uridine kinase
VSPDPTARREFFDSQALEILHNYGRGRVVVAVDGGVGAEQFAASLLAAIERAGHSGVTASIDDFVTPRSTRGNEQDADRAYFDERYDYATFRRVLIDPFRQGGGAAYVTAAFDEQADRAIEPVWRTSPADAVLVVFGPFLARAELRGVFNYTIFLETPAVSSDLHRQHALEIYAGVAGPRFTATAIVDTTDPDTPRRVFADSC